MATSSKFVVGLAAIAAAAVAVPAYVRVVRPRQLRWGATDEEVARAMPGDDIVDRPNFNATRGISIDASPEEVWPWIVQMGFARAGWYSYDWIDNLGRASAREILPDYQLPQPGDLVPFGPRGKGLSVKSLDRNRTLVWWDRKGAASWIWALSPQPGGATRLVTRIRLHYNWKSPQILLHLAVEFGDIIVIRKCLTGIKERAEAIASQRRKQVEDFEVLVAEAYQGA
jgi:hypothetical protein